MLKAEPVPMPEQCRNLRDLRALEADLRITCAACGNSIVHKREDLIFNNSAHRISIELAELQERLGCGRPGCGSAAMILSPEPATSDPVELRRRRARTILLNLALEVLNANLPRTKREVVDTAEIRLALRVLHPYVRDENLLREYWREAILEDKKIWSGSHRAYAWIVGRITKNGYVVYAELR